MRLKIINTHGNQRFQFDVVSIDEAKSLFELYKKPTDTAYIYFEMKMPKEEVFVSDNGRPLSKAEIRKLQAIEKVPIKYPDVTAPKLSSIIFKDHSFTL